MSYTPRSGAQHVLRAGDVEAVVAGVGASLRTLRHAGRDLVVPFVADEVRPAYRGCTLAPWPNSIVDGRYRWAGADHVLPLTEPARGHALHGLAAWLEYEVRDAGDDHVTLAAILAPQAGYPWRIEVTTRFVVDAAGLHQSVTARNLSADPAPWGTGPHPYLVAGPSPLDEWTLTLPADLVLTVDERLSPVALRPVDLEDRDRFDYRVPRRLGAARIDHAYTALASVDGLTRVVLTDPTGTGVTMTWDARCPWVQVHTADLPGGPAQSGHRAGLAVEPMTCAPDAFNAASYPFDTGLSVLEPDAAATAGWSIGAC